MLFRKFYRFLLTSPVYLFIPMMLATDILLNIIATQVIVVDTKESSLFITEMGIWGGFIFVILIAPVFETVIFQWLAVEGAKYVFSKVKIKHYIFPVLVSAFIFGLNHYYNFSYMIVTFFSGSIYAFSYILIKKRRENPIVVISIMHALFNLIPFYQDFLSK